MNTHYTITRLLAEQRLFQALQLLKPLAVKTSDFRITDRLQSLTDNYRLLIQYFTSGNDDPRRKEVLSHLIAETFILLDDIEAVTTSDGPLLAQMKSKADAFVSDGNKYSSLKKVFYDTWLGKRTTDSDLLTEEEKQMFISALTLNILSRFSENNILSLCRLVLTQPRNTQLKALVCLLIVLNKYNERLPFFPKIKEQLTLIAINGTLQEAAYNVFEQLLSTSLTPLINQEMENLSKDLMPEIRNKKENIIIAIDELDEGNPEWGNMVKDVWGKHLDEVTRLHSEGADINYSSTKGILTDSFFHNDIANWFIPFGWDNPEITVDFASESGKLVKGILRANSEACDTDRYAICAIYRHIQGQLSNTKMPAIINDMSEFGDSAEPNIDLAEKNITLNYIRSLYRFFFNNPWKIENQMEGITHICGSHITQILLTDSQIMSLADRCLALNLFQEATTLLNDQSAVTLQKRGYALQKLEQYDKALEEYNKALLIASDSWTMTHVAFCLQKLNRYDQALAIYDQLLGSDKDNRKYLLHKASCLMALNLMNDALQVFFHLDLICPDDKNIQRGLAWCAFTTASPDNDNCHIAEQYLENLVYGEKPEYNDYINYGHVLLATGHRKEAVSIYHKAVENKEDRARFIKQMNDDKSLLLSKGISQEELALTIDATLMS